MNVEYNIVFVCCVSVFVEVIGRDFEVWWFGYCCVGVGLSVVL